MSELREQMVKDLQLSGITAGTQRKYLKEVTNLAKYFGKSLEELSEGEVKEYLVHMLQKQPKGGQVLGNQFLIFQDLTHFSHLH